MKKLPFLKKKINVLKMRSKNQQAVTELLITGDKCRNEWRVVKNDKSKTNTNKTSAYSIPSKVPSSVNLQNRFSSLMVTEERSIENESQVQTPTNYHQRIEIRNATSKSRAEKTKSTNYGSKL